jgi:hypothetical protein
VRFFPSIIVCFITVLAALPSCALGKGCSSKTAERGLVSLVPGDAHALLSVDAQGLRQTPAGRRLLKTLIDPGDCLHPLLAGKVEEVLVGYGGGRASGASFALLRCGGCSLEEMTACAARDFGLCFDEKPGPALGGKAFHYSPCRYDLYLGKVEEGVFALGVREGLSAVVAAADGKAPSMAGSKILDSLEKSLPAGSAVSLLVLDGKKFEEGVFGTGNPFMADLLAFRRAALGLRLGKGSIYAGGKLFYDAGGSPTAAEAAADIRARLLQLAVHPISVQLGLDAYVKRISVEEGEGIVDLSFGAGEKELFDFIDAKRDILTIGL